MSVTIRPLIQAVLAGVVAAALILGVRGLTAEAQDGETTTDSSTTSTEAATPPDPCTLITEGEAEAALGTSATEITDTGQCTYLADDLTGRSVSVAVTPPLPDDAGALEAAMQQMAQALDAEVRTIAAGEEAYAVIDDVIAQATVRGATGDTVVVVLTAFTGSADATAQTLTSLATTTVARL